SLAEDVPAVLADGATRAKGIYHCRLSFFDDGYSEVADSLTVHRYFGNDLGKLDKAVAGGAVFDRAYDDCGRILRFTDALGGATHCLRDILDRPVATIGPLGRQSTCEYNDDGALMMSADAAGGVTRVQRDP